MPQKLPTSPRYRKSAQALFLREKSIRSKNPSINSVTAAMNSEDRKLKEYTRQLREKQKVRRLYGVNEGQFRRYYKLALSSENTAERILQLLETRLDNAVYRAGLAPTRAASRQMVNHGQFLLNDARANIPSMTVKVGDTITVRKPAMFTDRTFESIASWIEVDKKKLSAVIKQYPTREDVDPDIHEQLIVEYYSR